MRNDEQEEDGIILSAVVLVMSECNKVGAGNIDLCVQVATLCNRTCRYAQIPRPISRERERMRVCMCYRERKRERGGGRREGERDREIERVREKCKWKEIIYIYFNPNSQ